MYQIIIFLLISFIFYFSLDNNKKGYEIRNKIKDTAKKRVTSPLQKYITELYDREILSYKKIKITPLYVIVFSILIFIISYLFFYNIFKIRSTALIISLPILVSPAIISKILILKHKRNIIKQLPMYVVNIKNHMTEQNDILVALRNTDVEAPLKKYTELFKNNIKRGMNVNQAFSLLRKEVGVKQFDDLIISFEVCYKNGGDFVKVLEKYIDIITKENTTRQETEEKAYSSIITLIAMLALNIFVIISFVFANNEYANIIRGSLLGKIIMNFNILSYMFIGYLISKIYKEE